MNRYRTDKDFQDDWDALIERLRKTAGPVGGVNLINKENATKRRRAPKRS